MRTPRPLGTTELGKAYNNTLDDNHYQSLKQNIIHHYIRNNFSYCGQYMNIEQFAYIINETPMTIQKYMGTYGMELSKLNDEMFNKDMMRALANLSINFCLEDRSLAVQQLRILTESQGGTYAPFISGEVNKGIRLMMDANTNIQALMRTLGGSGNGSLMPLGDPNPGNENNGITVDMAIRILKENNVTPLLQDDKARQNLYDEYGIADMPEVNALLQIGMDTSKEGLGIQDITKLQKIAHEDRREEEYNIDQDQDDI